MEVNYLFHGDNMDLLRSLPDNSVDAIVTDPPYGLGKEPDALAMLTDWITEGHHDVKGRGFMGKEWDAFVPQPRVWRECRRVLKPGGHLLAFAGTRTQDLMALGLRIAGFEIRDLVAWIYGSGMPKIHNIGKAIDKAAGAEREVVRRQTQGRLAFAPGQDNDRSATTLDITAPATPEAQQWEGWANALKPALEPITLARKPFPGTIAANVLQWGTGGLNIDGCRVGTEEVKEKTSIKPERKSTGIYGDFGETKRFNGNGTAHTKGRWPANLIHSGCPEVVRLFPETTGSASPRTNKGKGNNCYGEFETVTTQNDAWGDSGSAARFFYTAKASKADRGGAHNKHPTVKPESLMRYLCRLITPPGGIVLDPYAGSGTTLVAAREEGFKYIGAEMDAESVATAERRLREKPLNLFNQDFIE
jgi:DNA modification methylase